MGLFLAQTKGKTGERRALAGSFREERVLGLLRVQLGLVWIEECSDLLHEIRCSFLKEDLLYCSSTSIQIRGNPWF